MRVVASLLIGGLLALPAAAAPPTVEGCDVFPADNVWNARIDYLPVHPLSETWIQEIGPNDELHADFGSGVWPPGSDSPIGIPWVDVPGSQPEVEIVYTEAGDESDPGPFPIPPDAPREGGPTTDSGDRHVLVIDRDACVLYELYLAIKQPDDDWDAYSGAVFDLGANDLRPETWTSADAAGLPIFPGLVRYEEVDAGEIRHALRFTAPQTLDEFIWPARHQAGDPGPYPPMGARFRLRADYPTAGFSPHAVVIIEAMKRYGLLLADNGSPWYVTGAPHPSWDNDVLHELDVIVGSDFEAIDTSGMTSDTESARVERFFADGFERGDTSAWTP